MGLAGAPLALRREIERVAGTTGKSLAQLIRLALLMLCANPVAASTARTSDDSTDHHETDTVSEVGSRQDD